MGASGTLAGFRAANPLRSTGTASSPNRSSYSSTVFNSRPHVDQEHLTLVIARIIAETQGLLNNFLRRTHGQWGLLHEVLHRRTAAVDRGAIKEGAELAARILRILAHKDLPTQTYDSLISTAVTVIFVAFPVQLNHALRVFLRPEDVVVEEAVAVVCRLLRNFGSTDAAVPYERGNTVERARG